MKYERMSNRETESEQRTRFQVELEFVQCLANPNYLNFLAQRGIFKDKAFVNYLNYLQYWKKPEYAKFLKYPMALHFLDLLQYEHFRKEISSSQCAKFIEDQQLLHWQFYIRKRTRLLQNAVAAATANNSNPGSIVNTASSTVNNSTTTVPTTAGIGILSGNANISGTPIISTTESSTPLHQLTTFK